MVCVLYAERRSYVDYAESHYTECCFTECRGALFHGTMALLLSYSIATNKIVFNNETQQFRKKNLMIFFSRPDPGRSDVNPGLNPDPRS
jgi:hypothetical protein